MGGDRYSWEHELKDFTGDALTLNRQPIPTWDNANAECVLTTVVITKKTGS